MRIEQALDVLHASSTAQFESLSDLISSGLITSLLQQEGGHPAPPSHPHGASRLGHHRHGHVPPL